MLSDDARKVLTVLWNQHRNAPFRVDLDRLRTLTQRNKPRIKTAINILVKEGYVLWDRENKSFCVVYNSEEAKPKPFKWNWQESPPT